MQYEAWLHEETVLNEAQLHEEELLDEALRHEEELLDEALHGEELLDEARLHEETLLHEARLHEEELLDEALRHEEELLDEALHGEGLLDEARLHEETLLHEALLHEETLLHEALLHETQTNCHRCDAQHMDTEHSDPPSSWAKAIYLVATYHMPNRDCYAIYDGINQQQLLETLNSVLVYGLLLFLSLILLVFVLKRMLGLSPIQQIAFVLKSKSTTFRSASCFGSCTTSRAHCNTSAATTVFNSLGCQQT